MTRQEKLAMLIRNLDFDPDSGPLSADETFICHQHWARIRNSRIPPRRWVVGLHALGHTDYEISVYLKMDMWMVYRLIWNWKNTGIEEKMETGSFRELDAGPPEARVQLDPDDWDFRHSGTRLNLAKVRFIREEYAKGGLSYQYIANEMGLAASTVAAVVRREAWGHVE